MVQRGNKARLRSPTKYGAEARRGDEARRGEATHPMLLLTEQSASSLSHRNFYGGIGLSLVAVVSHESQWDWFDLQCGYRHGFGFPLL
uniref:Uncharacterized protein n=1 Tax=Fagus sylvatica TaxID=28930 RepID=A0A2N9G2U7_FAGSY